MKWYKFDASKGSAQKRPPIKKYVVVRLMSTHRTLSDGLAVGYRKDAAGDPQSPYFVVPGIGGCVIAWCDCLPDDFQYPVEEAPEPNATYEEIMTGQFCAKTCQRKGKRWVCLKKKGHKTGRCEFIQTEGSISEAKQ